MSGRWGRKGSGRHEYTSDEIRGLTEDLCRRHVYVDHGFGERLEHCLGNNL